MSLQLSQLALCYHCMVNHQMISRISHSKLTVWVWSFFVFLSDKCLTHSSKLIESSQAVPQCESSGELSLSMVLSHTFTGFWLPLPARLHWCQTQDLSRGQTWDLAIASSAHYHWAYQRPYPVKVRLCDDGVDHSIAQLCIDAHKLKEMAGKKNAGLDSC